MDIGMNVSQRIARLEAELTELKNAIKPQNQLIENGTIGFAVVEV